MIVSTGLDDLHTFTPCAVALGAFDGLHRGHRALIDRLVGVAREKGLCSVVFTFDPHPDILLHPDKPLPMLMTKAEKEETLCSLGVDSLHYQRFDEAFRAMEPGRFIDFLVANMSTKVIMAGYNYRYGYQGRGDARTLAEACEAQGIEAVIIPPVYINGAAVSSTRIRSALASGDIDLANQLLGYAYSIQGTVVKGRSRGRTLGFPTANIYLKDAHKMLPAAGVYITKASWEDETHYALTNVGVNPTFERDHTIRVETHIPSWSSELYGKRMRIEFLARLRDERAFDTREAFVSQLTRDLSAFEKFVYKKKDM